MLARNSNRGARTVKCAGHTVGITEWHEAESRIALNYVVKPVGDAGTRRDLAQRDNFSERTMGYLLRMVVRASPPEKTSIIQSKWQTNQGSLYLPINVGELQRNKNLVQNDFYAK